MSLADLLARTFTQKTVGIIMLIFVLTVVGVSVAALSDITWLGLVIMIIGIVLLVVYTTFAIIKLKKKANEIRESLTLRIETAERDHHVKVEEVFATGFPCCPPLLPMLLNIFTNA